MYILHILFLCFAKKYPELKLCKTRMHSGRMRTARSSSHLLGWGVSVSVHAGIHTPLGVGLETPPRCRPGDTPSQTPQSPPWVWAWRPPWPDPSTFPPGCGPGDPPPARPLNLPFGCGPGDLQGMLGYHPPSWTEFLTHTSEYTTLPQLRCRW